MICNKCDPAGHIAGEEREYLKRAHDDAMSELKRLHQVLSQVVDGSRPPDRFLGAHIADTMRDLDAIANLQIVVGIL